MRKPDETPQERSDRLAAIQQAIATGTYETPERLSAAVDALAADFDARADSDDRRLRRPK
jgi:hypothetical protein